MSHIQAIVKESIRQVLLDWENREWTLQGLGMLRTYLGTDKAVRLHVWDSRYVAPGVSELHTHPWDFSSYIVAGQVGHQRWIVDDEGAPFMAQDVRCGKGGGLIDQPRPVGLRFCSEEHYVEGASYEMTAEEIHRVLPLDGSVSIIERSFRANTEIATVFWPDGTVWGSAETRRAKPHEVQDILKVARGTWF